MNEEEKKSIHTQVRNLLMVFGGGVLAAFLIAAFFVFKYGPTGSYVLDDALLAPSLLNQLNYNDTNSKTGGFDRFIFDRIEFTYFDDKQKTWKTVPVDEKQYSDFYKKISTLNSIIDPAQELEALFSKGPISKLTLIVKTESSQSWQALTKIFQEVQFASDGAHFRVLLHEQNVGEHWTYFYQPNIFYEASSLFIR